MLGSEKGVNADVTSGLEAAGDAVTGMVVGRAVEPSHGEGRGQSHAVCLNCAQPFHGNHCNHCGQAAHVHRSLMSIGHDILHGVFHFEGKIWRTLPMLAWRPGDLTRRYIHGERAKFVSPLALFLFSVFLMFAVVDSLAGEARMPTDTVQAHLKDKPLAELDKGLKQQRAIKTQLDAQIKAAEATDTDTQALEKQLNAVETEIDYIETAQDVLKGKKWTVTDLKTGFTKIDEAIDKANENPNLFLYKLQSSAYKYSWALIPLSTPFIWLLYLWKRQYKVYDHAIFVIYSLSFMLLLVAALSALGFVGIGEPFVPLLAIFVPPLHTYRQLRGAYRSSRTGAVLRTILIMVFGVLVLTLFVMLLVARGVMG
jgi:hypothetical protein